MAKPRVFVSSTYYDLKYIRASLELFIESLGFEPVLSEKGDIAYTSDRPLDESCYREAENADIFVLIVGGRYGSEASTGTKRSKGFFDRYDSITKKEYGRAVDREIPVYVLIERAVNAEFQTFIRNKEITDIQYAHVDSVNVFLLIEEILAKPSNNPVQMFDKFEDIESWLREQWSGLFRELLRRQAQQQQLASLSEQVGQLKETNETLKTYLEALMRGVDEEETLKLIEHEERRLTKSRLVAAFRRNHWIDYVLSRCKGLNPEDVESALRASTGFEDFTDKIESLSDEHDIGARLLDTLRRHEGARDDLNKARRMLGLGLFNAPRGWKDRGEKTDATKRRLAKRSASSQGTSSPSSEPKPAVKSVTALAKPGSAAVKNSPNVGPAKP